MYAWTNSDCIRRTLVNIGYTLDYTPTSKATRSCYVVSVQRNDVMSAQSQIASDTMECVDVSGRSEIWPDILVLIVFGQKLCGYWLSW